MGEQFKGKQRASAAAGLFNAAVLWYKYGLSDLGFRRWTMMHFARQAGAALAGRIFTIMQRSTDSLIAMAWRQLTCCTVAVGIQQRNDVLYEQMRSSMSATVQQVTGERDMYFTEASILKTSLADSSFQRDAAQTHAQTSQALTMQFSTRR